MAKHETGFEDRFVVPKPLRQHHELRDGRAEFLAAKAKDLAEVALDGLKQNRGRSMGIGGVALGLGLATGASRRRR